MVKIDFVILRFTLFAFKFIPMAICYAIGKIIGLLWFYLIRYRRDIVFDNLTRAFQGEKNKQEIYKIARQNFIHYGTNLIEFLKLPHTSDDNLKKHLVPGGIEHFHAALQQKKGLIVILGHYGNWDLMSVAQVLLGLNGYVITKKARNKSIDRFWQKIREDKGVHFISNKKSIFKIMKLLKKNKIIFMVFDQHMGNNMGIWVNFFNRPASTMRVVALLANKMGVPVIPVHSWRRGKKHYFQAQKQIDLIVGKNDEETIRLTTQKYNDVLEEFIKKCPEQWLWIHKRWKSVG